jgi:dTDP-4-dehydrorhamnose 3,5-epimerase
LSGRNPPIDDVPSIPGVRRVTLPGGTDERGSFTEIFRREWLPDIFGDEIQVNCSVSRKGTLRGLHFHLRQTDLWFPCSGLVRAALADVRPASPAYGKTSLLELRGGEPAGIIIPPGVAHGFLAIDDSSLVYVVNRHYDGTDEQGIAWDDPDLGIEWGCSDPLLSNRDRSNPSFRMLETAFRRKAEDR